MYNAAVWLREIRKGLEQPLEIRWRSFPLEQVNQEDQSWLFWEQSLADTRSLGAFLAAEAVRDQGDEVFQEFVFRLLEAVHQRKLKVDDSETIREAAQAVPGLDVARMQSVAEKPELRERVARDYREGADRQGVFGTPTIMFKDGDGVFLKMTLPPAEQAMSIFETVQALSCTQPFIRELKKPRRPE